MDGFCLLYLLLISLMRSGDVETNPGPNTAERYGMHNYTSLLSNYFRSSCVQSGLLAYTTFHETEDHVKMHVQDVIFSRFYAGFSQSVG